MSAFVLYAITWFLTFYIVIMLRPRSQQDVGVIVPGTPAGAPAEENVGRSALIATAFGTAIWLALVAIILSGWITTEDLDFRGILSKDEEVQPLSQ
ncbi:DUF1467 family protein [Pseudogemmobacter faecipullorum]|nr:DUF1467 family protein [Pseudogemmobacter faecipullorum]